jgi:hypothetical protein
MWKFAETTVSRSSSVGHVGFTTLECTVYSTVDCLYGVRCTTQSCAGNFLFRYIFMTHGSTV